MSDFQTLELTFEPNDMLTVCMEALVDGRLTMEQHADLGRMLASDPMARSWFVDYMQVHASLTWEGGDLDLDDTSGGATSLRQVAPAHAFPTSLWHSTLGYFSSGWPVAYLIATVIFGIGALIGTFTYVSQPVQMATKSSTRLAPVDKSQVECIGRITGMVDCKWAKDSVPPFNHDAVPLGYEFKLESGLTEIGYNTGAKVILQGPVTYTVESKNGGFMSVGKVTAECVKGFAVRTPTAIVTDLGTEFGIEVDDKGGTTSHVFRGSVRVCTVGDGRKPEGVSRVLHENESVRVEGGGANRTIMSVSSSKPADFVRELPKSSVKVLDLVDVVAGGDGFSGQRNRGIDSTNGRIVRVAVSPTVLQAGFPLGDGRYHRVEAMPFVDGVFVPDGRSGPVQLDSAGHAFGEFANSSNQVARYIWAGGRIPRNDPTLSPKVSTQLGDVDYASPDHGYLLLAANNGITFDLQVIRRAHPGCRLVRFRAVAANTEMNSEKGDAVLADVWVFVDGQVRFRRREINGFSGVFPISIPIDEKNRFLTLASLDAGNDIWNDDILFGDPRLELLSAEPRHGSYVQPK